MRDLTANVAHHITCEMQNEKFTCYAQVKHMLGPRSLTSTTQPFIRSFCTVVLRSRHKADNDITHMHVLQLSDKRWCHIALTHGFCRWQTKNASKHCFLKAITIKLTLFLDGQNHCLTVVYGPSGSPRIAQGNSLSNTTAVKHSVTQHRSEQR